MIVNIIGAGRVGQTLGGLLLKHKLAKLGGIVNQSIHSTKIAIHNMGAGHACYDLQQLPHAQLNLITTPDDQITNIAHNLAATTVLQTGDIVAHCSGSLTSTILSPLIKHGAHIASMHPMQSFASAAIAIQKFKGTYCALEGDVEAIKILTILLQAMGAKPYILSAKYKVLYHIAGVFASNYTVTLASIAMRYLITAGIQPELAKDIATQLIQHSLVNMQTCTQLKDALTGPLQRGDLETVRQHLATLSNTAANDTQALDQELYALLGLNTLSLTKLSAAQKDEIAQILKNNLKV